MSDPFDPADAGPLLPECDFADDIPRDAQGCLPVGALAAARDCRISHGECFSLQDFTKHTAHKEHTVAKHKPAPAPAPAPETVEPVADADAPQEAEAEVEEKLAPLAGPAAAPFAHVAEAPVPASAAAEIQALLPKDGSGGTGVTVILTLIAVGGGGAAWKFYQSFAKQKHVEKMKELEIKEKKIELQDDKNDHKVCELARANDRAAWEAKVAALESRLEAAEKPALPDLPFDPEELQQRLAELEKVLKKDTSKKPKKG